MFTIISCVLFIFVVLTVAYALFTRIGKRFFIGALRAEVAAVAMLSTFVIGYLVGHLYRTPTADTNVTTAASPQIPAPPVAVSKPRDVSAECYSKLTPQVGGNGSVDILSKGAVSSPIPWDKPFDRGASYSVVGWGVSLSKGDLALAACLVIDGRISTGIKSYYGVARPDVAAFFRSETDTYSGFIIAIPPNYLSIGQHTLQVAIKSRDQSMNFAAGLHTVIVR